LMTSLVSIWFSSPASFICASLDIVDALVDQLL
jgi:hypothetical protein